MTDFKDISISIKEAAKTYFARPEISIPRSTIQTWMEKGIFVPREPVAHRDPRGSKLDAYDLMTLWVIRTFIMCGVGYKSLLSLEEMYFEEADEDHLTKPALELWRSAGKKRLMQAYFQINRGETICHARPSVIWHRHEISLYPIKSDLNSLLMGFVNGQRVAQPDIILNTTSMWNWLKNLRF